jgi:hypothetical protein
MLHGVKSFHSTPDWTREIPQPAVLSPYDPRLGSRSIGQIEALKLTDLLTLRLRSSRSIGSLFQLIQLIRGT